MKTCPDCGSRVYDLGCTWCNESSYIEQQNHFDRLAEIERETERQASEQREGKSEKP